MKTADVGNKPTTKEIGDFGERKAARYLLRHGYWVVDRNYRAGKYEIDLIAVSWKHLIFVEVKTRSYRREELADAVPPSHAVDRDKIRFTRAAANRYRYEHFSTKSPRMDVIEVWLVDRKVEKIRHITGAY